ncbi:hypothetical protein [Allobranchiibius sp. CTAmp26]|uniref:hypothetical protein n=1 Tax=Allobranchiibius sp. CTAmp26 TaxID=2815214 RepID=UPI001AA0FDC3|nr:hypothetical protein [Allobranchiibius sp. CTAmp26]MBO1754895.1 hypothetical protein [Allobranchiibius sp. CTAmp26]
MRLALETFVLGPGGDAPASYRAGLEAAFRRYGGRGPFPADPDGNSGAVAGKSP